jgi:hypothetical protein
VEVSGVVFFVGSPVPLTFTLTNSAGQPVNAVATQPVVTVTLPDTTTATPAVSNTGPGIYTAAYDTTQAGHHTVKWVCSDATYPGGDADEFDVWSLTSTNVLSFSDAKSILSIAQSTTTWDDLVQKVNGSLTTWLEWYCGAIVPKTVVESLRVGGLVVQLSQPPVNELLAWTSVPSQFQFDTTRVVPTPPSPMYPVMVYGVTYPLSQLYADQKNGWVRHTSGLPFYYGPYLWQYLCGYSIIPQAIRYAAMVTLKHLFAIDRGGAAAVAAGAAVAAADEETVATPFGFAVPNRAIEALAPFQMPGVFA